jgi:hypothetical protein
MSKQDNKRAREMESNEAKVVVEFLRDLGELASVVDCRPGVSTEWPDIGDGSSAIIPFTIGIRSLLTKTEARRVAAVRRDIIKRYPKGYYFLHMFGYDEDPREIWEIVDAARYVRWFARYAGLDNFDDAARLLGQSPLSAAAARFGTSLGFLAACGVYGEEAKRAALANFKSTTAH